MLIAGVTVLDLIPTFPVNSSGLSSGTQAKTLLSPGQLMLVGPAQVATGGAAPNTGLALHQLGVPVRLAGRVGDDLFGKIILDLLAQRSPELARDMLVVPGETTSYSFVINPPGFDRAFLHCIGANDSFTADDIPLERLANTSLFHFGYLNVMRGMYVHEGREIQRLYRRAKSEGVVTSLDIAFPDINSEAYHQDWEAIFSALLPDVDFFLPSFNETLLLLDCQAYDRLTSQASRDQDSPAGILSGADGALISALGEHLLQLGAAIVGLKLGDQGLYLRTTSDSQRLAWITARLPIDPQAWRDRELIVPCFKVKVAGTVGAGDCTIAGFLAGSAAGQPPDAVMTAAVAAGACCVESADATSGVPSWENLQSRIQRGWDRLPLKLSLPGWQWDEAFHVWRGPHDHHS